MKHSSCCPGTPNAKQSEIKKYVILNKKDTANETKAQARTKKVFVQSNRTIQRAKEERGNPEEEKKAWEQMDWYCKKFEQLNQGSKASVEVDAKGVFESCFFFLKPNMEIMRRENAGVPHFALDATFMKESSGYKGVIYVLVGRTSENTVSHASKRMRIS